MAITKRAVAIQIQKESIREQIEAEYKAGAEAAKKVPDFVRSGSHQVAVAWTDRAAFFNAVESTRGPKSASVRELSGIRVHINQMVQGLCGKVPLV
jgi:hypothetical protein